VKSTAAVAAKTWGATDSRQVVGDGGLNAVGKDGTEGTGGGGGGHDGVGIVIVSYPT